MSLLEQLDVLEAEESDLGVLQEQLKVHTATYYDLENTEKRCNILQHTATHCTTLQHTAKHCNILHHTATHCNTLHHMEAEKSELGVL